MYDRLTDAIDKLGKEFEELEWDYVESDTASPLEKIQGWPGVEDEDITLCIYKGKEYFELFHRQDYFFFNFAYKGSYQALSYKNNNQITIAEGECYISQPYAGYAINSKSEDDTIIVGVLIKREAFFRHYFQTLSADKKLFHFFLNPQTNAHSEEFIHLTFEDDYSIRSLLNLMMLEYADRNENTQSILRPLTLSVLMQISKQYKASNPEDVSLSLAEQIEVYISEHYNHVTLADLAKHFSYHPNYISTILTKELGKSFSEIVLEQRMERAVGFLKGTTLSISDIAELLGYSNNSNFYKAFREYYGISPREYCS